jgi:hypothetical protein
MWPVPVDARAPGDDSAGHGRSQRNGEGKHPPPLRQLTELTQRGERVECVSQHTSSEPRARGGAARQRMPGSRAEHHIARAEGADEEPRTRSPSVATYE